MYLFRQNHLLALLAGYEQSKAPIDFYVSSYFRSNKSLGSKDRAYLAETIYRLIRWRGLIDYFISAPATWAKRLEWLESHNPKDFLQNEQIPESSRASFPEALYGFFKESLGDKAFSVAVASNEQAPCCIRVNTLKCTRDQLCERLTALGLRVSRGQASETAIYIHDKCNFFVLDPFKEGLFEVQDEASQLVAHMVAARPQQSVLDFCAGSAGKTLAFAPLMQKSGQIFLHDIRPHALVEAKKRLKRAGIQNAQIVVSTDEKRLKVLKKRMDWVLVDAPCSGTGTLRRNPDMKWKFSEEMLRRLVSEQRVIFKQALSYVKPGGHIVYATCSVLKEENSEQQAHFLQTYPIELASSPFQSFPEAGKMDGFFAVTFRKTANASN